MNKAQKLHKLSWINLCITFYSNFTTNYSPDDIKDFDFSVVVVWSVLWFMYSHT